MTSVKALSCAGHLERESQASACHRLWPLTSWGSTAPGLERAEGVQSAPSHPVKNAHYSVPDSGYRISA